MKPCLTIPYNTKLRSIDLMDSLERCNQAGEKEFNCILLTDCFWIKKDFEYAVSLIIEKWDWREPFINDFMTFSRFKKNVAAKHFDNSNDKVPAVVSQVLDVPSVDVKFPFSRVVLLHAQNSGNRVGFGSNSFCQGMRYGETSTYMFTGAILTRKQL